MDTPRKLPYTWDFHVDGGLSGKLMWSSWAVCDHLICDHGLWKFGFIIHSCHLPASSCHLKKVIVKVKSQEVYNVMKESSNFGKHYCCL